MKRIPLILPIIAAVLVPSFQAFAQSSIAPSDKFAWQENCGFTNWRDAGSPAAAQGVRVHVTFLSGFAWGENTGYINFGDGTPANGVSYANLSGLDFGVNLNPSTGALTGLAWGENIGWINFNGGALATPAQPAGLNSAARRFRGYAWGENIGWLNLDHITHFVGLRCVADVDDGTGTGAPDDGVTIDDLLYYIELFRQGLVSADLDDGSSTGTPDGGVTIDDLLYYLLRFEVGC